MTDPSGLARRIAQVGSLIDPGLTDRDVERLIRATERRIRRRGTAVRGGLAIAVVGVSVVLAMRLRAPSSPTSPTSSPASSPTGGALVASKSVPGGESTIHLRDGSSATPLDGGSVLATVED